MESQAQKKERLKWLRIRLHLEMMWERSKTKKKER